ncbi:4-hydroxyphenylacetate 3-hydroxylase N-terminal domain-containing protein [Desulfosporosinus hippei]|uniref:4-hydroxybutyryl-CoA dehydratase / vinylacetyl-CoA-Delta-isomerase n=1 Tax=Desulfosporosinus hippei DSM 8344 TaxID=1121419 RepID=A0A1G8GUX0_9FIRM|nr:4-hydroxyphenylacetate 3-hydroxylase N-terminal domain-containing protein [Desulfosporosinus hippei]SDH98215.1 4-hydroxybutyryl-CoA dehydratase / vinylacetyl-CoA-Delta-isomerase [Desulfosporosinus hippei DSM 8344]
MKTATEYLESMKAYNPRIFLGGKQVNLHENSTALTVLRANARVYELAEDPKYADIMTVISAYSGEKVSRNLHISSSTADLEKRSEMATLTSQMLGTCNYRCVGADVLNALAGITWEMDKELGTNYHSRLLNHLKYLQENDLAVSGGVTDAKGDRTKRPVEQEDPDVYVHVVEKREDGIVVRGAKVSQSGAIGSHETLVIPTMGMRQGEEDFAVAFAVPNGTEGLTYICQYTPFTAERELSPDVKYLGNPLYGQRETCIMVFDNVFIPWEHVFMCGETKYSGRLVARFAKTHRMNCGGACKVGFADLIIGATQLAAEYSGVQKAPHIVEKMTDMIRINETARACTIAAALKGHEEPAGSGFFQPDDIFGNAAKLTIADGFWDILKWAGDIGGGMAVTMPSELELENPETAHYVRKFMKASAPAEQRLRISKFIQNWCAGLHGAGTWHGAGSPMAQKMALYALTNFEEKKNLARSLAGLREE